MELKNKLVQVKFEENEKLVILVVVLVFVAMLHARTELYYCYQCCEGPSVKQSTSNPNYCCYNVFNVLQ